MVAVEYLLFNFGKKVDFINYCQKTLNSSASRVPRSSHALIPFNLYKKNKKDLVKYFKNFDG